jgi:hypothetical protein
MPFWANNDREFNANNISAAINKKGDRSKRKLHPVRLSELLPGFVVNEFFNVEI